MKQYVDTRHASDHLISGCSNGCRSGGAFVFWANESRGPRNHVRKANAKKTIGKTRRQIRAASPKPTAAHAPLTGRRRRGRPPKASPRTLPLPAASGVDAQESPDLIQSETGLDLTQKVKDLLRLAKEQGHLTYEDLNNALPDDIATPADLDHVLTKLRSLEIEVIDAAEAERDRTVEADDDEGRDRYDILDDPVRMYLRQMGKVPLLTREQEVEICKRIE